MKPKSKYEEKAKLGYMDRGGIIVYIKSEKMYLDIAKDCSNKIFYFYLLFYYLEGKIKKIVGLMKDELGGKVMTGFAALRTETYSYLTDNKDENKKAKGTKNVSLNKNLRL